MKFEKNELEIITKKYEGHIAFLKKVAIAGVILFGILAFIPMGIFPKASRKGISGSLVDSFGLVPALLIVLAIVAVFCLLLYLINIPNLKKDLEKQEKTIGRVNVSRIENLSAELASQMEGNKDTILHFERNDFGIKNFYFNKKRNPEYLNAKQMEIERAKYSKIEFKTEIIG